MHRKKMIKVAIVGCGKIADQHAAKIQTIPDSKIVAVCDREELMAKQLAERFDIPAYYSNVEQLLTKTRPDVVHITTPPQGHFVVGKTCLEHGCHIYMEKPFTVNTVEAEKLIELANQQNLKMTVGHNLQFSHAMMRMRELIKQGYLGGDPVHLESFYCYDLGDEKYARAVLGDKKHWIRSLPGKLLHNLISHGISKIAEFIKSNEPKVIAYGFNSKLLKHINENDIIDELRVIIHDEDNKTAYFTFSSQMRPPLRHFRIYGPENSLIIDDDNQTLIKVRGKSYKSYLNQFIPPFSYARQYLSNARYNITKFLKNDFHTDVGMKYLIKLFYQSVTGENSLPISYKEILVTTRIMDQIFSQIFNVTSHQ